jgi:hypothetical protein
MNHLRSPNSYTNSVDSYRISYIGSVVLKRMPRFQLRSREVYPSPLAQMSYGDSCASPTPILASSTIFYDFLNNDVANYARHTDG